MVHLAKHLNEWNSILVHALEIKEQPQNPQQSNLPARLNPHVFISLLDFVFVLLHFSLISYGFIFTF